VRLSGPAENRHGFAVIMINDFNTKNYTFSLLLFAGFEVVDQT
jgi:hypothetical protein